MSFDAFKALSMMSKGMEMSNRDEALRLETDEYVVDTCLCYDTGKWETAIMVGDKEWVVVEDYADADEAKVGHDKWVAQMKENPKMKLKSIQYLFEEGDLDEDDE